jgi:TP901 family phage tail tape measure protein
VSVLVNILTTYNGAGAKKAMRDMAVMGKQATLAGSKMSAGMLAASAAMQRAGARTAAVGASWSKRLTMPVLGFAGASIYAAATVEKGLNRVRAGTGATGRKLEGLEGSFRKVAAGSGKDMETIGRAIADVNTRLGLTGRPLETVTTKFLTLSRVTGQDVSTMLTEVSKAANDAGVKSGEMAGFLDKLLVTSQQTGASISSLASDMYRYGSPLRQVGFGVSETMATLGAFDKAGVNTKLVMGSLRIALGKMAKAGEKDLPAGLAKGIAAIKDAKTGGDAAAKAIELFGARAGPDMAAAIREGRFEVADLIRQLEGSAGAVERTGKATQTFSGKMAVLRNKATLAGEGFGLLLLPYLEKLVAVGARVVAWLGRLDGGTRRWVMGIALAVAAMGPALVVIGKATSGVGRMVGVVGKLSLAFGKGGKAAPAWARGVAAVTKGLASFVKQAALAIASITRQAAAWVAETAAKVAATAATVAHSAATKASAAAQWLLNAALTANPIGLVVAAVAALVAVIVVLWKKNETFRRVVTAAWGAIKAAAVAVWSWLASAFKKWGKGILVAITGPIGILVITAIRNWGKIKDAAARVWAAIKSAATTAWNAVKGFLSRVWGLIVAAFKLSPVGIIAGHWQKILSAATGMWSRIKGVISGAWSKIVGVFSNVGSRFLSIGSAIISGIKNGITGAWGQFESWFKGLIGKPVQWAKDILHIGSPSRVFIEIGGYVAEGLAVGMKGGENAVRRASSDLAGSTVPGFGGRRSFADPGGFGGRSVSIVIMPGAVPISIGEGGRGSGVTRADVDAAVRRGFRELAAELSRR